MTSFRGGLFLFMVVAAVMVSMTIGRERSRRVDLVKQIEFRSKVQTFMAGLPEKLRDPEECDPVLGGQRITAGTVSTLNQGEVFKFPPEGAFIEAAELATLGPDMRLKINDLPGYMTRYPASLRFLFRSQDGKMRVNWRESKIDENDLGVKLYVWVDPTGKIVSCHGPDSPASLCNLTNGFYYNQECRPTLRVVDLGAKDPFVAQGVGTCRTQGLSLSGECQLPLSENAADRNCLTGKCLPARDLCQQCE